VKIEVIFEGETFWLSLRKMGALFGVEVQTINYHLKEIFKSGELEEEATIRKIRIVQIEGNRKVAREVDIGNAEVITDFRNDHLFLAVKACRNNGFIHDTFC
jgi:hypothetical protein